MYFAFEIYIKKVYLSAYYIVYKVFYPTGNKINKYYLVFDPMIKFFFDEI